VIGTIKWQVFSHLLHFNYEIVWSTFQLRTSDSFRQSLLRRQGRRIKQWSVFFPFKRHSPHARACKAVELKAADLPTTVIPSTSIGVAANPAIAISVVAKVAG